MIFSDIPGFTSLFTHWKTMIEKRERPSRPRARAIHIVQTFWSADIDPLPNRCFLGSYPSI